MILEVRLFAGLAKYVHLLKIPEQEAYVTMVNGTAVSRSAKLSNGDRVGIIPAVGGG